MPASFVMRSHFGPKRVLSYRCVEWSDAACHRGCNVVNQDLGDVRFCCRWRVVSGRVPLKNRHMRALGARTLDGEKIGAPLVAWVRESVDWSLGNVAGYDDATLVLKVHAGGRASLDVTEYRRPKERSANDLLRRAERGRREAESCGVSSEDLWVVSGGVLLWGLTMGAYACGTSSLVSQLARTLGYAVTVVDDLAAQLAETGFRPDMEVFLASDEHGVLAATDRTGTIAQRFESSYNTLLADERRKARR